MSKAAFLILAIIGASACLALKTHEADLSHQASMEKRENHKQGAEIASAAASAAATELVKQLVDRPQDVAAIPSRTIQGYIQGGRQLFEGAWNLKDRTRSLQLSFSNLLPSNTIDIVESYFDSGTWYESWQPTIAPRSITQGTVANKQGSWFCGVTGSVKLQIRGTNTFIYIGFNNPYIGSYKFYGEISNVNRPARYGYDKSENNNPFSRYFDRYRIQVVQTPTRKPELGQMAFVYQISLA